jgi:outer membrane immunogenic protein
MKKLAAVAIAGLLSSPVFAADMPVKALAAPPATLIGWTGWYAGANVGYGFGSNRIDIDPVSPGAVIRAGFVSPQLTDRPKGVLGGLQFGANKQVGNFVYGFETDLSYAGIRDNVTGPFLIPPFNFLTMDGQRLDWLGTLRARAGVTLDRSLIFVTGGLAYGRASLSTFAIDTSASICGGTIKFCVAGSSENWMVGWTLGAGWEYAIAPNWSAKLEYLYYDLGTISNSMLDILDPPDNFRGSTEIKGNIVRVGLNYRFAN